MRHPDGTIRKARISFDVASHAHELTFCCSRRLPLLSKDRPRRWFLDVLDQARQRWAIWFLFRFGDVSPMSYNVLWLGRVEHLKWQEWGIGSRA